MRATNFMLAAVTVLFVSTAAQAEIGNFGEAVPGVYRGARLYSEADYTQLADLGVKHIVNLEFFLNDSKENCEANDLTCVEFGIFLPGINGGDRIFNYNKLQEAFRYVTKHAEAGEKVFVHCFWGKDRSGAMAAALTLRSLVCDQEPFSRETVRQTVLGDLESYGFNKTKYQTLYATIDSWTTDTPAWICAD